MFCNKNFVFKKKVLCLRYELVCVFKNKKGVCIKIFSLKKKCIRRDLKKRRFQKNVFFKKYKFLFSIYIYVHAYVSAHICVVKFVFFFYWCLRIFLLFPVNFLVVFCVFSLPLLPVQLAGFFFSSIFFRTDFRFSAFPPKRLPSIFPHK